MTILLAAQAVNEKTLRNYEMKIVFRSCHRDIELRRSSSSSSVVVPKWPLSASRKTGGFLARDCVALATILRHGSHLRSLLCNWSGCPIVAEKWCNLYTINYSPFQTWIEIAHRLLIEINDAARR